MGSSEIGKHMGWEAKDLGGRAWEAKDFGGKSLEGQELRRQELGRQRT